MQRHDSYSSGLDLRTVLFYITLALFFCQDEEICVENCIVVDNWLTFNLCVWM